MHLGLDFDNVVIDSHSANVASVNMLYGTSFTPEEVHTSIYTELIGEPVENEDFLLIRISELTPIHTRVPVEFSVENLQDLVSKGAQFTIITARPQISHGEIELYCEKNEISVEAVVCLDNRYADHDKKANTCRELGLDGLIDDQAMYLDHCEDLDHSILLHRPCNRRNVVPSHVVQTHSWGEINAYLSQFL